MVEEETAREAVWPPPGPDSRKMRRGEHQKNGKFLKLGIVKKALKHLLLRGTWWVPLSPLPSHCDRRGWWWGIPWDLGWQLGTGGLTWGRADPLMAARAQL